MTITNSSQSFTMMRQIHMFLRAFRQHSNHWLSDNLNSVSQSMALEETRLPYLLKLTVLTLSGATAIFIMWAAITPVKEIARTEGQVLPSGYTQLVQHLEGGLVHEILVHEGDFVQKSQVLVRLDGAGLEEDFHEQQALVESLSLESERIHALLENRPPNFNNLHASDTAMAQQKRMYEATLAAQSLERAVIDEQIAAKKTAIPRLREMLATARRNVDTARESRDIYAALNEKKLAAHTTYLQKLEEYNTKQGEVSSIAQQIQQAQRELDEFARRREALSDQQRDTSYTELNKVDGDLAQALENLKKRNDRVERLEVKSPVMGYIKGLKLNTIGSVIPAGQTLMEIVPIDEQLIVEARILPQQIGRVAVGQDVQVKIDSYDYVRFGTIPGKLESISAMTFSDEVRHQDYYKGRVHLDRSYAGTVPGTHSVMPGMTVDADIVTGEKSILGYLLKPIQIAMHNALTEQ